MSKTTRIDSDGRIYIPSEQRKELDEDAEYKIVAYDGKLKLIPVPDDPIAALQGLIPADAIDDRSAEEIAYEHAIEGFERGRGE